MKNRELIDELLNQHMNADVDVFYEGDAVGDVNDLCLGGDVQVNYNGTQVYLMLVESK